MFEIIIYLLIPTAAGITYFWTRSSERSRAKLDASRNKATIERLDAELSLTKTTSDSYKLELTRTQEEFRNASQNAVTWKTKYEETVKNYEDKLKTLSNAKEEMTNSFEVLAQKIFDAKMQTLKTNNNDQIGSLLNPLKEQLTEFKRKVEDTYDKESKDRLSLFNEITQLKGLNQRLSDEAQALTQALKGDNKAQGNWGELVLERILETSGLRKDIEYTTQESILGDDGRRYQPDVIVKLPENKQIIIDSKVSLLAYDRYLSSDDEETKQRALTELVQSLKAHVKGLSEKGYDKLPGLVTPEFVLLFMPIEAAFLTCMEADQTIFQTAFDKHIILVSPSTLLITLRTIQNIWQYEYRSQNAEKIAKQAGDLYDKFVGFTESLEEIGSKLAQAQEAHSTAINRLSHGKGNLVARTQTIKALGARTKKNIANHLIANSENPN